MATKKSNEAKKEAVPDETSPYIVLSPIDTGEGKALPGEAIELTDKAAAELIACGAVRAPDVVVAAPAADA